VGKIIFPTLFSPVFSKAVRVAYPKLTPVRMRFSWAIR
jgi:hypothetical protein